MSRNIVFEGWLTKSPPTKRIWRTKWRRRWFALRQSGELPGQYFLDYYADRNCRRLKGTINLDLCEQVDAGLHMERTGNGTLDPKLRGSVFTIQTQQRTYHLEADCEADMERWVDAICRVCGLRSTDDSALDNFQTNICMNTLSSLNEQNESNDTGPYIPISECITGVRTQDTKAFTFDPKNIVISTRTPLERVSNNRNQKMYMSQPQIRLNQTELSENDSNLSEEESRSLTASQSNIIRKNYMSQPQIRLIQTELSENDSNLSEEESRSLTASQSNINDQKIDVQSSRSVTLKSTETRTRINAGDWAVAKTFTKLSINQKKNGLSSVPPEPPPRPPKTLRDYQGPRVQEPVDIHEPTKNVRRSKRSPRQTSPVRPMFTQLTPARVTDDEDDLQHHQISWVEPTPVPQPSTSRQSLRGKRVRFADEEDPSCNMVRVASTCTKLAKFDPTLFFDDDELTDYQMGLMRQKRSPVPTTSGRPFSNQIAPRYTDDEDDAHHHQSLQYCNLSTLSSMPLTLPMPIPQPPAVDRALKPRHSSIGHINHILGQGLQSGAARDTRNDALQYLDLDLRSSNSSLSKPCEAPQQKKPAKEINHGKSLSAVETESDSAYKTVDFLKTEAFNITRQDAEASRSTQTEFK